MAEEKEIIYTSQLMRQPRNDQLDKFFADSLRWPLHKVQMHSLDQLRQEMTRRELVKPDPPPSAAISMVESKHESKPPKMKKPRKSQKNQPPLVEKNLAQTIADPARETTSTKKSLDTLIQTGNQFLGAIKDMQQPSFSSSAGSSLSADSTPYNHILQEWYRTKIFPEQQWLQQCVEDYLQKLKIQAFIEEELKKNPPSPPGLDTFDFSAITLDFNRQRLEFKQMFEAINQRIAKNEEDLTRLLSSTEKLIQQGTPELYHYFREKAALLTNYIEDLKRLRDTTAPTIKNVMVPLSIPSAGLGNVSFQS